jgi:cytochrome c oxidase assembly protein subunit 15
VLAIASLVVQVLIIGTGGAVRLTGSGLGCPTWPLCTDASLVATPEMGIHGAIEFGNRLLSIIVGIVAVLLVVMLLRLRKDRRDLFVPALLVLVGTVLQGLIGGISVRVKLDPSVVGVHFGISVVLVVLASVIVYRAFFGRRGEYQTNGWLGPLTHVTSLFVAITVVVGILTTGSGPHAGDAATDRNGLDSALMQHVHSWPAYATLALTLVLVIGAVRTGRPLMRTSTIVLLAIELVQVAVGLTQARLGLPPLLVGIHMVLASLLAAAMAWVVLSLRSSQPNDGSA